MAGESYDEMRDLSRCHLPRPVLSFSSWFDLSGRHETPLIHCNHLRISSIDEYLCRILGIFFLLDQNLPRDQTPNTRHTRHTRHQRPLAVNS